MDEQAMRLATAWRERADQLDAYARRVRRGDPREARDAEASATDYRLAADDVEAAGTIAEYNRRRNQLAGEAG